MIWNHIAQVWEIRSQQALHETSALYGRRHETLAVMIASFIKPLRTTKS
jgi:hypothetical protein